MAHLPCKTDRAENGVVRHNIHVPKNLVRRAELADHRQVLLRWRRKACHAVLFTQWNWNRGARVFFLFLGEAMD